MLTRRPTGVRSCVERDAVAQRVGKRFQAIDAQVRAQHALDCDAPDARTGKPGDRPERRTAETWGSCQSHSPEKGVTLAHRRRAGARAVVGMGAVSSATTEGVRVNVQAV